MFWKKKGTYEKNGWGCPASWPTTVEKFSFTITSKKLSPPCHRPSAYHEPDTTAQVLVIRKGWSALTKAKSCRIQRNSKYAKPGSTKPRGPFANVAKPKIRPKTIAFALPPPVRYE